MDRLSPRGREPSAAARRAPVAGAASAVTDASTAVATNAHRQPNGIATAGSARPANSAPIGAPACIAPKATPWRDSGTCTSITPLEAGAASALPMPPITSSATSATADSAKAATPRQHATVVAAPASIDRRAPSRSTRWPAGGDTIAHTR